MLEVWWVGRARVHEGGWNAMLMGQSLLGQEDGLSLGGLVMGLDLLPQREVLGYFVDDVQVRVMDVSMYNGSAHQWVI